MWTGLLGGAHRRHATQYCYSPYTEGETEAQKGQLRKLPNMPELGRGLAGIPMQVAWQQTPALTTARHGLQASGRMNGWPFVGLLCLWLSGPLWGVGSVVTGPWALDRVSSCHASRPLFPFFQQRAAALRSARPPCPPRLLPRQNFSPAKVIVPGRPEPLNWFQMPCPRQRGWRRPGPAGEC